MTIQREDEVWPRTWAEIAFAWDGQLAMWNCTTWIAFDG